MAKSRFVTEQGMAIHEDLSDTTASTHEFLESVIIKQAADDDAILQFKSSDVAHGVTGVCETDTYGRFLKASAGNGGLQMDGLADTGATGLKLRGIMKTADAAKGTTAVGAIALVSSLLDGSSVVASGSNANMMTLSDGATARFVWDAEGSYFSDVENTVFDGYCDVAMLEAFDMETMRRNGVKVEFTDFLKEQKANLEKEGIVHYGEGKTAMVNWSKLAMLHNGAIRQVYKAMTEQFVALTSKIEELKKLK